MLPTVTAGAGTRDVEEDGSTAVSGRELIAVRHLTKRFGDAASPVVALSDIDFSISEGELVVVVGPSSCGKSTLLRILAELLPQTEGEAWLHGSPINGPRRAGVDASGSSDSEPDFCCAT